MKTLLYILLLIMTVQALAPVAAHAEHEQSVAAVQEMPGASELAPNDISDDAPDEAVEHCSQCHGFSPIADFTPICQALPAARLSLFAASIPQSPPELLLRPPSA